MFTGIKKRPEEENPNVLDNIDRSILKTAEAMFSHRIVNVDFYTATPLVDFDPLYSEFRLSEVSRVPVLRIFGSTPKGGGRRVLDSIASAYQDTGCQKTCAHIHGVFPYITILADSSIENMERRITVAIDQAVNAFLETAIKARYNRNSATQQHVFKIVKVIGRTFYGFRPKDETFLRIYFYNPLIIKKVVDLLLNGSILNQKFQPYEAHIPYQLQFMIDFNLFGMNLIHYANMKFRRKPGMVISVSPISSYKSASYFSSGSGGVLKVWDLAQLPDSMFSSASLERSSVCELEIDVMACDIIVSSSTSGARSCNPGINAIWQDEMERRRQRDEQNWSQITIPQSQDRVYQRQLFLSEAAHMKLLIEKLQALPTTIHSDSDGPLNSKPHGFENVVPSSQVMTHTPSDFSSDLPYNIDKRVEESELEDELFILLQELQKEKEEIEKQADSVEVNEFLEDRDEDVIGEKDEERDDVNAEDGSIWEQSFLCNTILDGIDELVEKEIREDGVNQVELNSQSHSPASKVSKEDDNIFQGDGQGGDSDSSHSSSDAVLRSTPLDRRNLRSSVSLETKGDNKSISVHLKKSKSMVQIDTPPLKKPGRPRLAVKRNSELKIKSSSAIVELKESQEPKQKNSPKSSSRLSLANRRKSILENELNATVMELKKPTEPEEFDTPTASTKPPDNRFFVVEVVEAGTNLTTFESIKSVSVEPEQYSSPKLTSRLSRIANKQNPNLGNESMTTTVDLNELAEPQHSDAAKPVSRLSRASRRKSQVPIESKSAIVESTHTKKPTEPESHSPSLASEIPPIVERRKYKLKPKEPVLPAANLKEIVVPEPCEVTKRRNLAARRKSKLVPKRTPVELQNETEPENKQLEKPDPPPPIDIKSEILPESNLVPLETNKSVKPKNPLSRKASSTISVTDKCIPSEILTHAVMKTAPEVENVISTAMTVQKSGRSSLRISARKTRMVAEGSSLDEQKNESKTKIDSSVEEKILVGKDSFKARERAVHISQPEVMRSVNKKELTPNKVLPVIILDRCNVIPRSPIASSHNEEKANVIIGSALNQITPRKNHVQLEKKQISMHNTLDQMKASNKDEAHTGTDICKMLTVVKSPVTIKLQGRDQNPANVTGIFYPHQEDGEDDGEGAIKHLNDIAYVPKVILNADVDEVGSSGFEEVLKNTDIVPVCSYQSLSNDLSELDQAINLQPDPEFGIIKRNENKKDDSNSKQSSQKSNQICDFPFHSILLSNNSKLITAAEDVEDQCEPKVQLAHIESLQISPPALIPTIPKQLADSGCQTEKVVITDDIELCTGEGEVRSQTSEIGIQTDSISVMGRQCQCVCVEHRITKDTSTGVQTDLFPKMKNKHLQTEFSDIMFKSKRFENSTVGTKSPSSPMSRNTSAVTISPSVSFSPRISSASIESGSPRSNTHKTRSPIPHSPKNSQKQSRSPQVSVSICNTRSPKVSNPGSNKKSPSPVAYKSFLKQILRRKSKSQGPNPSSMDVDEMQVDMSVNSIYEFSSPPLSDKDSSSPRKRNSVFEIKRSVSRSKARLRRMKKTADMLAANVFAPDVFQNEFEPLKQPPSFKSITKWIHSEKHISKLKKSETKSKELVKQSCLPDEERSSDEEIPENVRICFGEGESDTEENDDTFNHSVVSTKRSVLQTELVSNVKSPISSASIITPKSILKIYSCRRTDRGGTAKRKIRFQDDSSCKRLKLDQTTKDADVQVVKDEVVAPKNLEEILEPSKMIDLSELDGPSLKNNFGFEHDMSNLQDAKALHQHQYLTTWSVEIHCDVRDDLLPDPEFDPIVAIFIFISNDVPESFWKPKQVYKCLLVHPKIPKEPSSQGSVCEYFPNEDKLFDGFLQLYQDWDPDMLVGYEIEKNSWGYIIDRGMQLGRNMIQLLSRLLPKKIPSYEKKDSSWDGLICGRIVLNLWNLLRHEITVQSYTYENAAYHILHRRVYRFSQKLLADFWNTPNERIRVFDYYEERVKGSIEIMETLDLINRTSELARLFGIQFFEVLSRGSQFRVESMMIRTAKPSNFIPVSPGIAQKAKMRSPEFLPLILEPQSNLYTDPVAVLDFQSLYPSMIIAYNYDYATVLGRVEHLGSNDSISLGCLETAVSPSDLQVLRDHIHISPAGVAFVDASIRKGILSEMLEQILDTRQMVKRSMKKWKNEGATIQKLLDSRQLGLKLIANVTYGYTAANYSGRMPCVEIADSVVSKGRETLQRAIDLVKANHSRWGGEVIYGDTDSMFIRFPGRDRLEAFKLGQEIADEVTQSNPKPVKLKLEKIYQPCILQSKKRYVGYSYETPDQMEPTYDAKGIETVRRDGCPAVKKILEKSLHILFTTNDHTKVQNFVQFQFKKLFTGRVSMKEYTFARAFRGRNGYKPGACVPSLEIAKKAIERDPRAEPLKKERVPYVVVYGKPTLPLIQLVRTPMEFMNDHTMRLNAHYYIEKAIIPALNRCLVLANMNVSKWYKDLPRKYLRNFLEENTIGQGTLDDYVHHGNCFRCDEKTEKGACLTCDVDVKRTASYLIQMTSDLSRKLETTRQICEICSGDDYKCINMDCPVFPKLLRYERDIYLNRQLQGKLNSIEW